MKMIKSLTICIILLAMYVQFISAYVIIHPLVKSFDVYWNHLSVDMKLSKFTQVQSLLDKAKTVVKTDKQDFVVQLYNEVSAYVDYLSTKIPTSSVSMGSYLFPSTLGNIDVEVIKKHWLDKHNQERVSVGVSPYIWDMRLDSTAQDRANTITDWKSATHKRYAGDSYYNYKGIEQWFADRGVRFRNINTRTFSESIGYGPYSCSSSDCTQSLIKAIDTSFAFFMSEKNKKRRPHYNGIVMKEFGVIGLGIGYDVANKRYYLVTHYGTEVID